MADFEKLVRLVFPHHAINKIRYFTARVNAPPYDPQKPQRQAIYLRALATIPSLTIHYGTFLSHVVKMPLANPTHGGPHLVDVIKTLTVGVLNPQRDPTKTSWTLMNVANFYRRVRPGVLMASQFPATLSDATGTIVKPTGW